MQEDWSQDFWRLVESVTVQVEEFFAELTRDATEAVEGLVKFSEEVTDHLEVTVFAEFDRNFEGFVEPFLEVLLGVEGVVDEAIEPVTHTVEPLLNEHPTCVGCRHYHGQIYGGTMLVCGMHPYGWESEKCPDWESTWVN